MKRKRMLIKNKKKKSNKGKNSKEENKWQKITHSYKQSHNNFLRKIKGKGEMEEEEKYISVTSGFICKYTYRTVVKQDKIPSYMNCKNYYQVTLLSLPL